MDKPLTKVCFKCGRELSIDNFYAHPRMADGHLNKCKDCAKKDVHAKYMENIENPEYVERERARGREKFKRLYKGIPTHAKHGNAANARRFLQTRIGAIPEDMELHHWNYNFPNKVFMISSRHHARLHKLITYDSETKCFTYNGKLLDTKESHEDVLKLAMPNVEYKYFDN